MIAALCRIADMVGRVLVALMVGLVFLAAVSRNFGYPIIWSVDLAQAIFIWLCFAGAIRALGSRAHIGVDYFVKKLPSAWRWPIDLALAILVVGFLGLMAYEGLQLTLLNRQRVFGDSGLSYAWVTIAVPIGCALMAVIVVRQAAASLRTRSLIFSRDRTAEGPDEMAHQDI